MSHASTRIALILSIAAVLVAGFELWRGYQSRQAIAGQMDKILDQIEKVSQTTAASLNRQKSKLSQLQTGQINEESNQSQAISEQDRALNSQQRLNSVQANDLEYLSSERIRQEKKIDDLYYQVQSLKREVNGLSRDLARLR